jgi:hypothetical protein
LFNIIKDAIYHLYPKIPVKKPAIPPATPNSLVPINASIPPIPNLILFLIPYTCSLSASSNYLLPSIILSKTR